MSSSSIQKLSWRPWVPRTGRGVNTEHTPKERRAPESTWTEELYYRIRTVYTNKIHRVVMVYRVVIPCLWVCVWLWVHTLIALNRWAPVCTCSHAEHLYGGCFWKTAQWWTQGVSNRLISECVYALAFWSTLCCSTWWSQPAVVRTSELPGTQHTPRTKSWCLTSR